MQVEVFIVLLTVLMVIQFIVAVFLIFVVLLQQSAGEGLGSIGGGAQMFFDKAKGLDAGLEKATTAAAIAFMVLSMVLAIII
jgi:preprotein translocase subunit SecG